LAAYKDLAGPWKELLTNYQLQADARIKYDLLVDTFQPAGMLDEALQRQEVSKVLHEENLMAYFLDSGRQVAEVMVTLFADVEPGSDLFEQFSFISAEDLPQ